MNLSSGTAWQCRSQNWVLPVCFADAPDNGKGSTGDAAAQRELRLTCKVLPCEPVKDLQLDLTQLVHQRSWVLSDRWGPIRITSALGFKTRVVLASGTDPFAGGHRKRGPLLLSPQLHEREKLITLTNLQ
jgi:hypothetical protein